MKLLQAPTLKTIARTISMQTAIHSYDEQAFDNMSDESEKKLNCEEIVAACSKSGHV